MNNQLVRREGGGGLPSIEKARALLTQCRSVQECMRIKALAQAVASCADAEGAKNEAAAIVLLAKARVGELTVEAKAVAPKDRGAAGRGKKFVPVGNELTRTARLEAEGLSRKEAAECEKIADLKKSGDLDRMLAKSKTAPTTAAAVAMHRLPPEQRKQVLGKLGGDPDVRKAIGEVKLEAKRALADAMPAKRVSPLGSDGHPRMVNWPLRRLHRLAEYRDVLPSLPAVATR